MREIEPRRCHALGYLPKWTFLEVLIGSPVSDSSNFSNFTPYAPAVRTGWRPSS